MRKIVFLILILCASSTIYAKRYYVQLGTSGAAAWNVANIAPTDQLVDLSSPATTLRAWLSAQALNPNDEVWFAAGTYLSDVNTTSTSTRMFSIKNGVKYYGGFLGDETSISQRRVGTNPWDYTNETIMDGRKGDGYTGAAQGMFAAFPNNQTISADTVFFNGFTVKNFKRLMATNTGAGGVISVFNYAYIQNCKFTDNLLTASGAVGNGGGVFNIQYNGTPSGSQTIFAPSLIENCYFGRNRSDRTGGTSNVMYAAVGNVQSPATIKGCTFENNSTSGYCGAIAITQNTTNGILGGLTLDNCIFKGNRAEGGNAGALYYNQTNATAPLNIETIKNCQFISDTCSTAGGTAIQVNDGTKSKIDIQGCSFVGNYSAVSGGVALNIASTAIQSLAPVKNCIFRDNSGSASGTGEGVALSTVFPATTVYNCVFANNGGGASAVYLNSNTSKIYNSTFAKNNDIGLKFGSATTGNEAKNNIFWSNGTNAISGGTTPTLDYNAYNGTTGADGTNAVVSLDATNTFVTPTSYSGPDYMNNKAASDAANWNLKSGSPAINAGADLAASGVTTDILGNTRPTGANAVDMGAYEGIFVGGNQNISSYAANSDINVSSGGHLTVDATKTVKSITVTPGAKLTVNAALTATSGITLESDANGTATLMDSYTEPTISATVKQYVTAGRNWYMSAPHNNSANVTDLNKGASVQQYNETSGEWEVASGTLTRGKGYIQVANSTQGTTGTVQFNGILNSGDVSIALTYHSDGGKGFNLVGNPYPSYLNWQSVATDPVNTHVTTGAKMPTGTMWYRTVNYNGKSAWTPSTMYNTLNTIVYNGNKFFKLTGIGTSAASGGPAVVDNVTTNIVDGTAQWAYDGSVYIFATVNADGEVSPETVSNLVPPMQAFWVKSTGGTLTFKNSMRSHETVTNKLKAPKAYDKKLVRLRVSNGASADESVIYASNNALNTFDNYDAPKYFNTSSNQPEIYSQVGNEKLAINAMNEMSVGTEISLGFLTEKANNFSINASEIRNFESNVHVILKDKIRNSEFNLTNGDTYNFSSDVTNNSDRFSLLFRAPGVTTGIDNTTKLNAQVYVNAANQITIMASEKTTYSIYNAVGQLVNNGKTTTDRTIVNSIRQTGVYVVKLTENGTELTTRVIIK